MPTVTKLPPEEVKTIQDKGKSQRRLVAEQYDAMLAGFEVGDWGDVGFDPDDTRATVRNRLNAAAERRGFALRFARMRDDHMRFQVVAQGEVTVPTPASEPPPPAWDTPVSATEVVLPAEVPEVEATAPPRKRKRRMAETQPDTGDAAEPVAPPRKGGRRRKATDTSAEG